MKPLRFPEIDFFRGMAVCGMVLFHFLFDYNFLVAPIFVLQAGPWFWLGRLTAFAFVFLAGFSLALRVQRKNLHGKKRWFDFAKRGAFVFALGLFLTLFSFALFPRYTIWFGVLHLIGVSTVLSVPLVMRPKAAWLLGSLVFAFGLLFSVGLLPFPDWIAVFPISFSTFDYFPLFPWLGIFWLGIPFAHFWLKSRNNWILQGRLPWFFSNKPLAWLGRHSLWVYLAHQPVLVALILLLF